MSAGLGFASLLMGGISQYQAGQQRAQLGRLNAGVADMQARSEMDAGVYNESLVRRRGAAIQGAQINAIGANNLQQAGTPSQIVADTAGANELDALQTRNNALRRAWGFEVQGASDRFQADQASRAGKIALAGSIIGGTAQLYGKGGGSGSGLTLPSMGSVLADD